MEGAPDRMQVWDGLLVEEYYLPLQAHTMGEKELPKVALQAPNIETSLGMRHEGRHALRVEVWLVWGKALATELEGWNWVPYHSSMQVCQAEQWG